MRAAQLLVLSVIYNISFLRTAVTEISGLHRGSKIFSISGQSIIFFVVVTNSYFVFSLII